MLEDRYKVYVNQAEMLGWIVLTFEEWLEA